VSPACQRGSYRAPSHHEPRPSPGGEARGSVADQSRAAVLFLQGHGQPTATLAGYVEDAIRERLERDRAGLNTRERTSRPRPTSCALVGGSADLSTVVSVLRACYESRCGDQ
jgi:hypothetical protein